MHQKSKLAAVIVGSLLAANSHGGINNYSIGLHFGTDYANAVGGNPTVNTLDPTEVAGYPAVAQANWNNLTASSGSSDTIVANSNGVSIATAVHLEWTCANTWGSGGQGALFLPGTPDNKLMTTYLDTGNATTNLVTVTNLPAELTSQGYDVYVYAIGDGTATPPRGGSYRVMNASSGAAITPYKLVSTAINSTNYVQDLGTTHTNSPESGNYVVFRGLTNANIIIESTTGFNPQNGTPRAAINGVQIVAARSPGEVPSATAATAATNAGSGRVLLSWTPGAGSAGSVVIARLGAPVTAEPVDGIAYTGNNSYGLGDNLGNDWIGSPNYVVFSGSGSSVTVSNLPGGSAVNFAVFSYTGSGANINYSLASPAVANAVPPATLLSITLQLPTTRQTNFISQAAVLANFDSGNPVDVTATATYASGATSLATVNAAGLVSGVGSVAGTNVTITAAYQGRSNSVTINLVGPPPVSLINRYSFNGNANDSVGGKNGTLMNAATITGGEVVLANPGAPSSADSGLNYVDLPNNILTQLTGGVSFEFWLKDNNSANWGRVFDFGNSTGGEGNAGGGTDYMFLAIPGGGAAASRVAFNPLGAGEGNNIVNWTTGNGGRPVIGKKTHIVATVDPETRRGVIYADGVPVGTSTGFTASPASIGVSSNNWLGRSQYNDPYWDGSIDEFRIWSNSLTPLQVALNAAAGPDTVVADPGALQSISLLVSANMPRGGVQNAKVTGAYANASGVNLTTSGPGYSSDNTNIVTVSAAGLITAVAPGTANVTASFGGRSDSKAITVAAAPAAVLTHRYSFTADANDSVGTAHGTTAQGAPTYSGGLVTLSGQDSIALPAGIINGYESLSVEAWVYGPVFNDGGPLYLFGFGETNASAAAVNFVRVTLNSGGATPVTQAAINGTLFNNGVPVGIPTTQTAGYGALLGPTNHLVAVFDSAMRQTRIYLNGLLVQSTPTTVPLSTVSSMFSYIGQSIAPAESIKFAGYLDEFRLYNGAMNLEQVRISRAAGPNSVAAAGAFTSVSLTVPPAVILGNRPLPKVTGSSATVANIDLTQVASITSSDPSIISVLPSGQIRANALGSATITATMGAVSDSKLVQVAPTQTALMHRYNFNTDFNDSVGGAHAIPKGNATLDGGGNVSLDGTRSTFVELPKYLIDGYQAMTVEAWSMISSNGNNSRLFDFGSYDTAASPGGVSWIELAPRTTADNTRIEIDHGPDGQQGVNMAPSINDRGLMQVVAVFQTDPAQTRFANIYTNGILAASITNGNNTFIRSLRTLDDQWNFIGKSQWAGDSFMLGSIDEFRIYHGALSTAQVLANFTAGPNGTPSVGSGLSVPPLLSFSRSGNTIVLSWGDPAAALVAAGTADAAANTYTNVPGATSPYSVTPAGSQLFYRLKK